MVLSTLVASAAFRILSIVPNLPPPPCPSCGPSPDQQLVCLLVSVVRSLMGAPPC